MRPGWGFFLGVFLVVLSAVFYYLYYLALPDTGMIYRLIIGDLAFIPIDVLFVSLILHRIITEREKSRMFKKLNMVIGVFFSEVGTKLLRIISETDHQTDTIRPYLLAEDKWQDKETAGVLEKYDFIIEATPAQIEAVKTFLVEKRNFMLRLLENPNLLEHDAFTEVIWAVFHLIEELAARENISTLNESDLKHLVVDTQRVYSLLTKAWLGYMLHLRKDYPYLYSLAARMNPFDPEASPVIVE